MKCKKKIEKSLSLPLISALCPDGDQSLLPNYRKQLDRDEQMPILLEKDYPGAKVAVLIMDKLNLNTHSIGSLTPSC
jgi:hypothetical protein